MKINDIINEAPLPDDWEPQGLGADQSFYNRIEYATERAKQIGSGSARVAFIIPYQGRDTVLKVAKNNKGLAQNNSEVSLMSDGVIVQSGFVIPIIDFDDEHDQPHWIQTEKADPVSKSQLVQLLGATRISDIISLANFYARDFSKEYMNQGEFRSMQRLSSIPDEKIEHAMRLAQFFSDLKTSYDVELGDLTCAGNWGLWKGKPVIIDLGLTYAVYQNYYL